MNHLSLFNTLKTNLNTAIDKIIGVNERQYAKIADSFMEEQNSFYENNSLQWDEYGNPYIL